MNIIEKIAKILARADENRNDNDHEREIAMRQANALLVKHGLSMSDITDQTEQKDTFGKLGRQSVEMSTRYVWESGIFNEIARLNGCHVVRSGGRIKKVWLIGRQLNCQATRYLAEYVVKSIYRQAKTEGHAIAAFGVGAWTGVGNQVTRILNAQKQGEINGEQVTQSTALLVVNQHKQALVDATKARKEFFPRLKSSGYRYSGGNYDSRAAGRKFGENISLNKQVGGNRQKAITG